jgi:hypothetical protein
MTTAATTTTSTTSSTTTATTTTTTTTTKGGSEISLIHFVQIHFHKVRNKVKIFGYVNSALIKLNKISVAAARL